VRAVGWRGRGAVCSTAWLLLAVAAIAGCQEKLTSPGECPALCPGGEVQALDIVLRPIAGRDSTFSGYVNRGSGVALLVSNGLAVSDNRAAYRFASRPDSIVVGNDTVPYTIDSVAIALDLVARDTLVDGLKVYLYRVSEGITDTLTFAGLEAQLTPAGIIDSIEVPDTLNSGAIRTVLTGVDLAKVDLPLGGSGVLAIGVAMAADQPSGIRIGSAQAGNGATFITYVNVDVADTTTSVRKQVLSRTATFNTYLTRAALIPDPAFLTLGGDSASRVLLRFALPPEVAESASIVRATLELIPRGPIPGLPTDPAVLVGRAVLADLGAKSPVTIDPRFIVDDTLSANRADTVRMDVTRIVQLWQAASERPSAIFLTLLPEAATFMRAEFGSTRTDPTITPSAPEPVGAPRLRITYQRPFPFENP